MHSNNKSIYIACDLKYQCIYKILAIYMYPCILDLHMVVYGISTILDKQGLDVTPVLLAR